MKIKGLYRKRGWWYFQPATGADGVRPGAIALRTQDDEEAARMAFEEIERFQAAAGASRGRMDQAVRQYLKARADARAHTDRTAYNTEKALLQICEDMGNPKLADLTAEKCAAWAVDVRARGRRVAIRGSKVKVKRNKPVSDATVAAYSRVFRAFLGWAHGEGKILRNPSSALPAGRMKASRKMRFCTIAERDSLLDSAPDDLALILHLGFLAGLRFGEILAMEPDWFWFSEDGGRGKITVQRTAHWQPKDKEARVVPMAPRLLAFLAGLKVKGKFVLRPDKGKWPKPPKYRYNPSVAFAKHAAACGVSWLSYHDMRHSFGAHLAQRGAKIIEIAALLGDDVGVVEAHYVGFLPAGDDVVGLL